MIKLTGECQFTEGPIWHPEGYYLFSDITANRIYRISEDSGLSVFLEHSGTERPDDPLLKKGQEGSNGLAWLHNELIVCRHGSHDLARVRDGRAEVFLPGFEGRPFNSPNDIVVHSDGRVFFTDPPYGLKDGELNPELFQPAAGLYCLEGEQLTLWSLDYKYPNGVVLSPDEKVLYLCSTKEYENVVARFDTATGQRLEDFVRMDSDGIETDLLGNVYCCSKDGIVVFDPSGREISRIKLPKRPSNCAWGGKGGKDLLVTAREDVYLLKNLLPG